MEIRRDKKLALEIIAENYGGPIKYAKAVLEKWPKSDALVAFIEDVAVGAEIFYTVNTTLLICVHYYVAVVPQYRRRGIATALIKSVEEICNAEAYMAITTSDNEAAISLFTKLGYRQYFWSEIPRRARDVLLKATCGYDDDILFIKGVNPLRVASTDEVKTLWRETCLKPYLGW